MPSFCSVVIDDGNEALPDEPEEPPFASGGAVEDDGLSKGTPSRQSRR
jgi:hypothetical protein